MRRCRRMRRCEVCIKRSGDERYLMSVSGTQAASAIKALPLLARGLQLTIASIYTAGNDFREIKNGNVIALGVPCCVAQHDGAVGAGNRDRGRLCFRKLCESSLVHSL